MTSLAVGETTAPPSNDKVIKFVTGGLVLGLALAAGWLIYVRLLADRGPFGWDEANHALRGLQIAYDFRQGDWIGLLLDSYRQVLYPPLHSWLTAGAFALFGPSETSAALVSLICYVLILPALFMCGLALHPQRGEVAGVVAAAFFLASSLAVSYATQVMLEIPGILSLVVTIWIYLKLVRSDSPPSCDIWLGLGIAMTYFVRIQYGVLLFIVIMAAALFDIWYSGWRSSLRRLLFIGAPLVAIFAIWSAYPAKLTATLRWLVNYSNVEEPYSMEGWLFYLRAPAALAGSPWLLIVLVAGVAGSFAWFKRDRGVRLLLLLVIIEVVLALFHQNRQVRYLLPVFPASVLLTGFAFAEWWSRANRSARPAVRWLPRATVILLLIFSAALFVQTLVTTPNAPEYGPPLAAKIRAVIGDAGTALVIGTMDIAQPSPPLLDWQLLTTGMIEDAAQAGSAAQLDEERSLVETLNSWPQLAWLKPALMRSSRSGVTRTIYLGLPQRSSYSQSQAGFDETFRHLYALGGYDSVVIITSMRDSARYPLEYIAPTLQSVGLRHDFAEEYGNAKVRVDVYR